MRLIPRLVLVLTAVVVLGACDGPKHLRVWTPADHGQPSDVDPSRVPAGDTSADTGDPRLAAAAALWRVSCAGCHGQSGHGDGAERPPGAQVPDMTTAAWQGSQTDAQLAAIIAQGRGMMPPFGNQVSSQGISSLVAYVRSLGPSGASGPGGTQGSADGSGAGDPAGAAAGARAPGARPSAGTRRPAPTAPR